MDDCRLTVTAGLFIITKKVVWKKCHTHTYIHTLIYYLVLKKKAILSWMKLKDIMLNE